MKRNHNKPISPILIPLLILFTLSSCSSLRRLFSPQIDVLHYNIYELESKKLAKKDHPQLKAVKETLEGVDFDILSINEIQFDKPQIPNKNFHTFGLNFLKFTQWLRPEQEWNTTFTEANTGRNAVWGEVEKPDLVNFGRFPGQYSTGLASKYEVVGKIEVKKLGWREFRPQTKTYKYRDGSGKKLPAKMELFDKSFTDTIVKIRGNVVHLITLHTVPAYHFGNKKSPNYQRNADQLRFLEWYTTGKTDFEVKLPEKYSHVKPLSPDTTFIAMGDWNTEIDNRVNPGSKVLRRLDQTGRLFPSLKNIKSDRELYITNEAPDYAPNRLTLVLDYLMWSKDLEPINLSVIRPKEERLFIGCGKSSLAAKESDDRIKVSFKKFNETCYKTINRKFHTAKNASDHFPVLGSFKFR